MYQRSQEKGTHVLTLCRLGMHGSRGGIGGSDPIFPLENHKAIGFLSNTGPDPLENHKATKPSFNLGPSSAHQRNPI